MTWECGYCLKQFQRESAFLRHKCPEMERAEKTQSIQGQAAYVYYSEWMKAYKRKVPPIETFTTSRYFNSFVKFAVYVKKLNIARPDAFVRLMKEKDISPMLWTRDECYTMYLEWNDRRSAPMEQAEITIKTIIDITDAANIEPAEVFNVMHPREIVQLVRLRKLSPWILLCSTAFKDLLTRMEDHDKEELLNVIGYNYWATKFEQNPEIVEQMKVFAKEMGI